MNILLHFHDRSIKRIKNEQTGLKSYKRPGASIYSFDPASRLTVTSFALHSYIELMIAMN